MSSTGVLCMRVGEAGNCVPVNGSTLLEITLLVGGWKGNVPLLDGEKGRGTHNLIGERWHSVLKELNLCQVLWRQQVHTRGHL